MRGLLARCLRCCGEWLVGAWTVIKLTALFYWAGLCFGLGLIAAALLASSLLSARVAGAAEIPRQAQAHRALLVRAAHHGWGLDAPVATLAAQVHQESGWRADALSPAGAQGLGQIMPATAAWLPEIAPGLGAPDAWNPGWSLRALVAYDRWLWERVRAADDCQRMAKALAAYNGGLGWVRRDERLAGARGLDPQQWWGNVETVNAGRSAAAKNENRQYPRRILLTLEPVYAAAGWGAGRCGAGRR